MATVLAENYQLKWHSHSAHLHSSVATLYRSDNFTDVTLVTTDGRYLAAHKFVLSACSSYLNRILQISCLGGGGGASPNNSNVVIVLPPDIGYRTLAILLQYMYSGEATVSNDQLNGVLKAGEILRIKGLCHNKEKRPSSSGENMRKEMMMNGGPESAMKPVFVNVKTKPNNLLHMADMASASGEGHSSSASSKQQQQQSLLKTTTSFMQLDKQQVEKMMSERENSCESSSKDGSPVVNACTVGDIRIEENMKIELLVKEEPIDWDDHDESCENNQQDLDQTISFKTVNDALEQVVKTSNKVSSDVTEDCKGNNPTGLWRRESPGNTDENNMYAPLTCDMCQETFTTPALWVRHIETHPPTDIPRKRRKRITGGEEQEDDSCEFPPLRCELCQEVFTSPADWVRHIQSAHTDEQLALSNSAGHNNSSSSGPGGGGAPGGDPIPVSPPSSSSSSAVKRKATVGRETCPSCTKTFPSHASMLIHSRTHTGEKPYICCVCEKGFNVKSNLLRHLRTLHDHLINPGEAN